MQELAERFQGSLDLLQATAGGSEGQEAVSRSTQHQPSRITQKLAHGAEDGALAGDAASPFTILDWQQAPNAISDPQWDEHQGPLKVRPLVSPLFRPTVCTIAFCQILTTEY